MTDEQEKPKRDYSMPLTAETFAHYQEEKGEEGPTMLSGYLDATAHLLTILRQLETAKSFAVMKKKLTAFRKDREKFERSLYGTFDGKNTKKYLGRTLD